MPDQSCIGTEKAGAEAKEWRHMCWDTCGCNAIKGRHGNLKRTYGLDFIYCKLDENTKAEAALNNLAMNEAYRL